MRGSLLLTGGTGLPALNWALAVRDRIGVVLGIHRRKSLWMGTIANRSVWSSTRPSAALCRVWSSIRRDDECRALRGCHLPMCRRYVKKMPSMTITDIAKAVVSEAEYDIIGILPDEKLYEKMLRSKLVYSTYRYAGYYEILQACNAWRDDPKRLKNGVKVPKGFIHLGQQLE
jgi:hypothetical protein